MHVQFAKSRDFAKRLAADDRRARVAAGSPSVSSTVAGMAPSAALVAARHAEDAAAEHRLPPAGEAEAAAGVEAGGVRVAGVAMRVFDAATRELVGWYSAPAPARHDEMMRQSFAAGHGPNVGLIRETGFVDENGGWLSRREAVFVAYRAGQIQTPNSRFGDGQTLYSEDVW